MRNRDARQARYMRDALPIRLGNLAANFARVESFSDHDGHREVVERLLEETKFFLEWTTQDAEPDVQVELVSFQRQIARWQLEWSKIWVDHSRRAAVATQAGEWSERLLVLAGLHH